MKALFDTNIASYWMGGVSRFHWPLKQAIGDLRVQRATLFLSTVSLHEILVFSRTRGSVDRDYEFLAERFNFLPFDEPCASNAARLAALVGSPRRPDRRKPGPVSDNAVDVWHRDAAIAGTADHHAVDWLLSADRGLAHLFGPHLQCVMRLIEGADVAPPGSPPPAGGPSA